jgi:predicted lipid-binding transport protein (Tim44 family)
MEDRRDLVDCRLNACERRFWLAVGKAHCLRWGVIQISLTNFLIIVGIVVLFLLAFVIPFPHSQAEQQPSASAPTSTCSTPGRCTWAKAAPADVVATADVVARATADQQTKWSTAYADALTAAPDGDPAKVEAGATARCRPSPVTSSRLLQAGRCRVC